MVNDLSNERYHKNKVLYCRCLKVGEKTIDKSLLSIVIDRTPEIPRIDASQR